MWNWHAKWQLFQSITVQLSWVFFFNGLHYAVHPEKKNTHIHYRDREKLECNIIVNRSKKAHSWYKKVQRRTALFLLFCSFWFSSYVVGFLSFSLISFIFFRSDTFHLYINTYAINQNLHALCTCIHTSTHKTQGLCVHHRNEPRKFLKKKIKT